MAEFMERQLDELEELPELDDLEMLEKYYNGLGFPALTIGKHQLYFNELAAHYMETWKRAKVYISPEYLIFLPAPDWEKNSFSVWTGKDKTGRRCGKPTALIARHPQTGTYKLMKYKNGFAVKRYEPINPPQ